MPAPHPETGSIVVALDGSQPAQTAAAIAVEIARHQAMAIRGLYVVECALVMNPYGNPRAELGKAAGAGSRSDLIACSQMQGERLLANLAAKCHEAGVPFSAEIVLGSVPAIVCQRAVEGCLLPLGRSGHHHGSNLHRLGPNFRGVARRVRCPYIAGGSEVRVLRRLLIAYNGSMRAARALSLAVSLQSSRAADLVVLSVRESRGDPVEQYARQARERLDRPALSRCEFVNIRSGDPTEAIIAASIESRADCILMGGSRHIAPVEWLAGNAINRVLTS